MTTDTSFEPFFLASDRYEIVEAIGQGGMGIVYKAKDHSLDRYVAIKSILRNTDTFQSDGDLKREARFLATLSHPNILQVHDLLFERGCLWIISEWLDGIPLDHLNNVCGPVTTACIVLQTIDALEMIHKRGLIHRDVKPSNIFLTRNGTIKLIDFGVVFHPEFSSGVTIVGSYRYADPRMLDGQRPQSTSDYYAAGVVGFELMRGQPVWEGSSLLTLYRDMNNRLNERLDALKMGLHPIVSEACAGMISSIQKKNSTFQLTPVRQKLQQFLLDIGIVSTEEILKKNLLSDRWDDSEWREQLRIHAEKSASSPELRARDKAVWLSYLSGQPSPSISRGMR